MFVIWNVGQGQWLTYMDDEHCTHFDMGGERADHALILNFCGDKKNRLWLSHGDWDHLNLIRKSSLPDLCLISKRPLVRSKAKARLLAQVKDCAGDHTGSPVWIPPATEKTTNGQSLVTMKRAVLIPGDSATAQERRWALNGPFARSRVLIAGHHGSRTSTGDFLLSRLPHLKQSIASGRRGRYGHPHFEVEVRLRGRGVPLITTEDWGNIRIED